MKGQILVLVAAFAVFPSCARRQAYARPRLWYGRLYIEGGRDAQNCSDLRVRATGELASAIENFRMSKSQTPVLELRVNHSAVHVRGWDRPDYGIEVCKFVTATSRSAADQAMRSIVINRNGGRLSVTGPDHDARWETVFFVHSPKDASLNLESANAPIDAAGVSGQLNIRASNGPLSLDRCSGTIDAETLNGPIAMNGGAGDVHLRASQWPDLAEPG
jgi:hypothetical protein